MITFKQFMERTYPLANDMISNNSPHGATANIPGGEKSMMNWWGRQYQPGEGRGAVDWDNPETVMIYFRSVVQKIADMTGILFSDSPADPVSSAMIKGFIPTDTIIPIDMIASTSAFRYPESLLRLTDIPWLMNFGIITTHGNYEDPETRTVKVDPSGQPVPAVKVHKAKIEEAIRYLKSRNALHWIASKSLGTAREYMSYIWPHATQTSQSDFTMRK